MSRKKSNFTGNLIATLIVFSLIAMVGFYNAFANQKDMHTSSKFEGPKANTGTVVHSKEGKNNVLTLSNDFVVPETPDPHWQIVDSKGNVYLLNRLKIKDDKYNQRIVLPSYIKDVAKVQIWCAWAEVVLGEAAFEKPLS